MVGAADSVLITEMSLIRSVFHREVLLYRVFIDWPVQGAVERGETHLFIRGLS